jgi:hypothetical protein
VKLRQKSRLFGNASTFGRIVEPVVVNPETVSKNASIKLGIYPLIKKGSAPKSDIRIHESATITYPSLAYMTDFVAFFLRQSKPVTARAAIVREKEMSVSSPYITAPIAGNTSNAASTSRILPMLLKIMG